MSSTPVAITGVGAATADTMDSAAVAALLHDVRLRSLNVETKLLLAAARLALRDAGLDGGAIDPDRWGVAAATGHAGQQDFVELFLAGIGREDRAVNPARAPLAGLNAPAAHVSIDFGAAGPNVTVASGAAGGLDALRYAVDALAGDRADAMLVCGVDVDRAIAPSGAGGEQAAGASVVVVERPGAARARSARVRALVAGVATAYSPHDDVAEARARARREALKAAGLTQGAVELGPAANGGDPDSTAAVSQLAAAASSLRRGEATGPLVVCASDAGYAGAAVLVSDERED